MKNLADIRKIIDNYDRELVNIFEKRLEAVLDILEYKRKNNIPIIQSNREGKVLEKVKSYLNNPEFENELENLYGNIFKISRQLQSKKLFPLNIVLIGFMGSGKTCVGKNLSQLLEMKYVDTDTLIVEETSKTINEIFEIHGEDYFRKLEIETIKRFEKNNNIIISCGGGVILNEENIKSLKKNGILIWLKATPEELYNRLSHDKSRPLLKDDFTIEHLSKTLNLRLSLYESSNDIEIDTDKKTVEEICNEIIKKLIK